MVNSVNKIVWYPWSRVEEGIGVPKVMSSILPCTLSLFLQEKSPEISGNYGKLQTFLAGKIAGTFR
jgi:hypothetical protein